MVANSGKKECSQEKESGGNPEAKQIKIVAIGDSITFGYPYTPSCSWVFHVRKMMGYTIYNKGVSGDSTGQMLNRFSRDCLELTPSHVIISGGTNDVFALKDVDEVIANITAMIEQASLKGIKTVIGLPPPLNIAADEKILALYRAEMEEVALAKKIATIKFHKAFLSTQGSIRRELFADGVHPNQEGYKIMAGAAALCLKEILR